jgi:transposase-like protein
MPRKYDLEFKLEAVRMTSEPVVSHKDVERRLGIDQAPICWLY